MLREEFPAHSVDRCWKDSHLHEKDRHDGRTERFARSPSMRALGLLISLCWPFLALCCLSSHFLCCPGLKQAPLLFCDCHCRRVLPFEFLLSSVLILPHCLFVSCLFSHVSGTRSTRFSLSLLSWSMSCILLVFCCRGAAPPVPFPPSHVHFVAYLHVFHPRVLVTGLACISCHVLCCLTVLPLRDVHWVVFFFGKDYLENLHSTKNQTQRTIRQLFDLSQKLITDQTEIQGISKIGWHTHTPFAKDNFVNRRVRRSHQN